MKCSICGIHYRWTTSIIQYKAIYCLWRDQYIKSNCSPINYAFFLHNQFTKNIIAVIIISDAWQLIVISTLLQRVSEGQPTNYRSLLSHYNPEHKSRAPEMLPSGTAPDTAKSEGQGNPTFITSDTSRLPTMYGVSLFINNLVPHEPMICTVHLILIAAMSVMLQLCWK